MIMVNDRHLGSLCFLFVFNSNHSSICICYGDIEDVNF